MLYNAMSISILLAKPGVGTKQALATNSLSLSNFLYIPRSKIERGMSYNAMSISVLAAKLTVAIHTSHCNRHAPIQFRARPPGLNRPVPQQSVRPSPWPSF